jgi:hypothetical protein
VQDELSPIIRELAPAGIAVDKIPFLSVGEDLGSRTVVCERESPLSGGE